MPEETLYRNITNQKVTDFINGYYKPINPEMEAFRKEAEADNIPIIQKDAERLLLTLLKLKNPRRIIEIGTAVGYSASCMALTLGDVQIMTLERSAEMLKEAAGNFEKLGIEKQIALIEGDASEFLSDLPNQEKFDFAFIDAAKGHYRDFFDKIVPHMNDGGVIVCDNMLFKARVVSDEYDQSKRYRTEVRRMREFVDYLFSLEYADSSYLTVGDGTTISIITKQDKE